MYRDSSRPVEIWSRRTVFWGQHILQWIVLVSFIILTLIWAAKIKFNNAPDELMRYMLPKFIYANGSLPLGTNKQVIYSLGNWSYAYYPQWLGPIISALFMKIMSLFNSSSTALLFSARLTSVFSGAVSLFILGKIIERITSSKLIAAFGMALLGFLPQYMYLSSYINNDIISIVGVSLILLVMLKTIDEGWSIVNCVELSFGFSICFLSYLNSYGFILGGGIYFLITSIIRVYQKKVSGKGFIKTILIVFIITGTFVFPFLIRNYILYHDVVGVKVFHSEYVRWLNAGGLKLQIPYQGNLFKLLVDNHFLESVWKSFIGQFGYMTISMSKLLYNLYSLVIIVGFVIAFGHYFMSLKKRRNNPTNLNSESKQLFLFSSIVILSSLITIGLHLYYCLNIDLQPQGRYLISLYIPIIIFVSYGYKKLLSLFTIVDQSWLITGFTFAMILLSIIVYKAYIIQLI